MRNKAILLLGVGAAFVYLYMRDLLSRLKYKIAGLQLVSITPEEIKVNVNVLINNPTNIRAVVGNFIANVFINEQYVGNINYPINRYLNPGVNSFTIGVVLNPTAAGQVLWQQLQSGNIYNMAMRVDGAVEIDNRKLNLSARFLLEDFWNFAK